MTDPDFWIARWASGDTGWHRTTAHPALDGPWAALDLPEGSHVLVPLCGASPDLRRLADLGHRVTGVELSPIACARFFDDQGWIPHRTTVGPYTAWTAHRVTLYQGDILALPATEAVDAVYDRAATIALPPDVRARYARTVTDALRPGARGLIITIVDPDRGDAGPPFSVDANALRAAWSAVHLTDIPPFDGLSPMERVTRVDRAG